MKNELPSLVRFSKHLQNEFLAWLQARTGQKLIDDCLTVSNVDAASIFYFLFPDFDKIFHFQQSFPPTGLHLCNKHHFEPVFPKLMEYSEHVAHRNPPDCSLLVGNTSRHLNLFLLTIRLEEVVLYQVELSHF